MENLKPLVSIVVTTYNSAHTIQACIQSIHEQIYPKDRIEIIVIDDGSDDNTKNILEKIKGIKHCFVNISTTAPVLSVTSISLSTGRI